MGLAAVGPWPALLINDIEPQNGGCFLCLGSESPMQPSSQNLGLPMNLGLIKDRATTEGRDIFFPGHLVNLSPQGYNCSALKQRARLHLEKGNQVPETAVLSVRT